MATSALFEMEPLDAGSVAYHVLQQCNSGYEAGGLYFGLEGAPVSVASITVYRGSAR
jgi:hypothetical protein